MLNTENNMLEENTPTNEQEVSENTSAESLEAEPVNDGANNQTSEVIKCPICQRELSSNEAFCPNCGHKVGLTEQEKVFSAKNT